MMEIGLTRSAYVVLMRLEAHVECPCQKVLVHRPKILPTDSQKVIKFLFVLTVVHPLLHARHTVIVVSYLTTN
jgi:hypothetical protein